MNHITVRFLSVVLGAAAVSAPTGAVILSNVPVLGTMVMPMIKYAAADGRLHAIVDPTVPQLTPLLISNPADQFDPTDPWHQSLDPKAQGLAFSRRYGFTMDTISDPLPDGFAIWIRKLSSSPGLESYRYRSSVPKTWQPIFGTAGSPDTLQWDGTMFHPCFAAPPGTNTFTATFEALLKDTVSGVEIPGTSTRSFQLNWTDAPDGRPELSIAYMIASWRICRKESPSRWHEAQARYYERVSRIYSPSSHDVRRSVHSRSLGRWHQYEKYLAPILPTLEPYCRALGYA